MKNNFKFKQDVYYVTDQILTRTTDVVYNLFPDGLEVYVYEQLEPYYVIRFDYNGSSWLFKDFENYMEFIGN